MKVSFEMNQEDFDNLVSILHKHVVKYKYDVPLDSSYSEAEIVWFEKHANYVQRDIIDKIILGIQK